MVGKMTRKSVRKDNYGLFHKPKPPTWRNNSRNSLTLLWSMDIFTGAIVTPVRFSVEKCALPSDRE